jgi:hypothetical protein
MDGEVNDIARQDAGGEPMNQRSHRTTTPTFARVWFRLYTEVLNDPKVQGLSDRLFRSWINVLCVASKYGGVLPEIAELAFLLRIKPERAKVLLEELRVVGLLDEIDGRIAPHNWKVRQYESDNSTARVNRFRNGQRNAERNVSGTVSATAPDTDTETDTETEKAVSNDTAPPAPVAGNKPPFVEPNIEARSNGKSMIRPEAFALAHQIAAAMGLDGAHPTVVGMPMKIEHWLASSWHPEIILATVQSIMATRRNDPPNNLNYFEKPIARAHAEQSRPLPIVAVSPVEANNVFQKNARRGGSLVAAIDRELAKLEREEEADLEVPANSVLRLPG